MHQTDFYRRLADEWACEMQLALAMGDAVAAEHARRERDNYLKMLDYANGTSS
ncbi:MAG: hypothetical protein Q4B82_08420 [Alysiella sp.]|uniref:hypothetical protein n=1 Tax=Alysiella sp. TaxID=1872483 RepID=UPI0026DB32F5|nr:hypothetical protein [Alysiella sp.]MDO4434586.1 hypothetical protein [Alysiella sp.]